MAAYWKIQAEGMEEVDIRLWIKSAPACVRDWLASSVPVRNLLRARHREAFQMIGRYDGAMSEACKERFEAEYRILTAILEETQR